MKNNTELNIIDNYNGDKYLPNIKQLECWIKPCLVNNYQHIAINLMLVDFTESQKFNINFRSKAGATNVLSFPYEDNTALMGDIVICSPLVIKEAKELNKSEESHWIHLFVHGILHLQGYDHQTDEQELVMTRLEDKAIAEILDSTKGNDI